MPSDRYAELRVIVSDTLPKARGGLLHFVDLLRDMGIMTFPKVTAEGRVTSLRFGRSLEESLTAGALGINDQMQAGTLYRSVTMHDPVFLELEARRQNGREQPRILDDAFEVLIAQRHAPAPGAVAGMHYMQIMRANDGDFAAERAFAVLDSWSHMDVDELRAAAYEKGATHEAVSKAEALPEAFRGSALRWICRGLREDLAVLRQDVLMEQAGIEMNGDSPSP